LPYHPDHPRVRQMLPHMHKPVSEIVVLTGLSKSSIYQIRSAAGITKTVYEMQFEARNRGNERLCPKCDTWKSIDDFRRHKQSPGGRCSVCLPCERNHKRRLHLKRSYGLTDACIDRLMSNYECSICCADEDLVVDHNHDTGAVRGLLCHKCNLGIGHLDDSIERLEKALNYLKLHATEAIP